MPLHGFAPVVFQDSQFLVLGSFPSEASLAEGFYYGHERNHFWPLLAIIAGTSVPRSIDEKKKLLEKSHIALWDMVASCERKGSLDQNIRESELNNIGLLLESHHSISRILLNGRRATELFFRHLIRKGGLLPDIGSMWEWDGLGAKPVLVFPLPSTSPVPSRQYRHLADKLPFWEQALQGGESFKRG
ncbi:DNA-deoxyinosine glycosylase [Gracilinema caldarium]|uniref:DNA-deoxyinosine glycosylase n=1 Tax=Gracilinema caldarium TaxID=215591 RepID=UPI0026F2C465|nr:DNA-deoxyinosine glycosylase [Gracilinema caldarium]